MNTKSYIPPERILMGPGPSNVDPRVLQALSHPTIGHLDPKFIELMDEIKSLLQYAFQTENEVTFPVSAPGSTGMETCLVNLVEPGMQVVVCQNGVFGGRMKDIVERCGATAIMVYAPWGSAINPADLEKTLEENPDVTLVSFVHAETSTGALSDIKILTTIAHKHNCLVIADTVTSLGGNPLKIDEWQIDAVYSGTQKCLSCPPGLSPASFNDRAVKFIKNRKTKVQSWFMDVSLVIGYWGGDAKRSYHHTAPINALYGLHESLIILKEEGLENAWKRHKENGRKFCEAIRTIGLEPFVKESERLPQLTSIGVPIGVDEAGVRNTLLNKNNIEIGAGLGDLAGKVWRVGLMGYSSNEKNISLCVDALKDALNSQHWL